VRIERDHVVLVPTQRQSAAPAPGLPEATIGRIPEAVRAWPWIEVEH
jgi:hypothetical protein